ncbi:MAG: choice-of-anchor L domain-containing protein [Bacteroidota bacterium]
MRKLLLFTGVCCITTAGFAQMTTTTGMTPLQYVQNVLLGGGVTVSNVTYTGYANAIGEFSITGPTNLGMSNGLVMTTGTAMSNDPTYGANMGPHGPNNAPGAGADNMQPGDPYLTGLAGTQTFNAAILEFDFMPVGDTVKFNYVFGTEEYMEWISGGFADVFAFVLSGVSTPLSPVNIAQIPSTGQPVTALNVNANVNPQYYVDNETPPGQTVQYDGFTVVLEAKHAVICGETYHIKIMIADAIDGAVDAGVFLEAGSFGSEGVNITAASITGGTTIAEGCGTAIFTFERPDTTGNFVFNFDIGGTATMGTDYTSVPDSVIISQGQTSTSITVDAFTDALNEGQETITFFIIYQNGCGNDTVQATIYIDNVEPLVLQTSPPAEICTDAGESASLSVTATGGYGPYSYVWDNGAGNNSTATVSPPNTTYYTVTVSDTCGNSVTSSPIEVLVQCDIIVPNVFSPNGDGVNDFFEVLYLDDYPNSKLVVYNRWGKIIYENANYQNNWNAKDVAEGTYYFILTPSDPEQGERHGHVTILR